MVNGATFRWNITVILIVVTIHESFLELDDLVHSFKLKTMVTLRKKNIEVALPLYSNFRTRSVDRAPKSKDNTYFAKIYGLNSNLDSVFHFQQSSRSCVFSLRDPVSQSESTNKTARWRISHLFTTAWRSLRICWDVISLAQDFSSSEKEKMIFSWNLSADRLYHISILL